MRIAAGPLLELQSGLGRPSDCICRRQECFTNLTERCVDEFGIAAFYLTGKFGYSNLRTFTETAADKIYVIRMVSLSFDRPRALSTFRAVPLPAFIDDEYLLEIGEGQQPPWLPSRLEFFAHGMKLLQLRERSLRHSEKDPDKESSGLELGIVLDVVTELDRYLEALPSHLRINNVSASGSTMHNNCFRLQARVLKARYNPRKGT